MRARGPGQSTAQRQPTPVSLTHALPKPLTSETRFSLSSPTTLPLVARVIPASWRSHMSWHDGPNSLASRHDARHISCRASLIARAQTLGTEPLGACHAASCCGRLVDAVLSIRAHRDPCHATYKAPFNHALYPRPPMGNFSPFRRRRWAVKGWGGRKAEEEEKEEEQVTDCWSFTTLALALVWCHWHSCTAWHGHDVHLLCLTTALSTPTTNPNSERCRPFASSLLLLATADEPSLASHRTIPMQIKCSRWSDCNLRTARDLSHPVFPSAPATA